jgi:glycosyltransferase involved in cell wall biosynthesis
LLVPSRVRETFGRTAALALMAGVPVIASDAGALPEFVRHGVNGRCFAAGDAPSLAEAMEAVIEQGQSFRAETEVWPDVPDLDAHLCGLLPLYGVAA